MIESLFDHNDPFEKRVFKHLMNYLQSKPHDKVLKSICRDFPYMSEDLRNRCEHAAYIYHYKDEGKNALAEFKQMAFLYGRDLDKPFQTHICESFQMNDGEDVYIAVMFENPLFHYKAAEMHCLIEINEHIIDEFAHVMSIDERRAVYYIPLKLIENGLLEKDDCNILPVKILDCNRPAFSFKKIITVFYGEVCAADVFKARCTLSGVPADESGKRFHIEMLALEMSVCLTYNGQYGPIVFDDILDGVVTFSPSDATDDSMTAISPILFNEHGLTLEGGCRVYQTKDCEPLDCTTALYDIKPGKYTIRLYIWGTLLDTMEIEITDESTELPSTGKDISTLLDEYLREWGLKDEEEGGDKVWCS